MLDHLRAEDQVEGLGGEGACGDVVTGELHRWEEGPQRFQVSLLDVRCRHRLELPSEGGEIHTGTRPHLERGMPASGAPDRTLYPSLSRLVEPLAGGILRLVESLLKSNDLFASGALFHALGFIAEDVPGLVASTDRISLSTMDIVAVLTRVVQEQQQKIAELEKRLDNESAQ